MDFTPDPVGGPRGAPPEETVRGKARQSTTNFVAWRGYATEYFK